MTIDQLRKAIKAQPFRPFTLRTADGGTYEVKHPEMVAIGPGAERTFIVAHAAEDYSVLDLLLVAAIDFRANGRKNGKNGKKKGSK